MRKIRYLLLGLLVALAGGALAVDTGGFPARPIFQGVTTNSATGVPCAFNASTACLTSTGTGVFGASIVGRASGGSSYGLLINAGNNSAADFPLLVRSRDNLTTYFSIDGTGAAGGTLFASGSFTSTLTNGCTTTPNATVSYIKQGNVVTLHWPATSWSCTSNALAHTTDASVPALIRPATSRCASPMIFENNGVFGVLGQIYVSSTGTLQFGTATSGTDCSTANSSSVNAFALNDTTVSYTVN